MTTDRTKPWKQPTSRSVNQDTTSIQASPAISLPWPRSSASAIGVMCGGGGIHETRSGPDFTKSVALGELSRSSWNSGGRLIYSSAVSAASRRSLASACALGFEAASIVTASIAEEIVFRACSCTCCRTLSSDSSTRDRRANTACLPITCRTRLGRFDGQAGEGQWLAAAPRHLYN